MTIERLQSTMRERNGLAAAPNAAEQKETRR
jgi:hypothetical protein